MHPAERDGIADTVGTDVGRRTLLREIVGKVDGLDATAPDEELDLWWGSVEVDRLASGLTLATIAKLMEADTGDEPAGPWLLMGGEAGHEVTQLTPEGREALRRIGAERAEPGAWPARQG